MLGSMRRFVLLFSLLSIPGGCGGSPESQAVGTPEDGARGAPPPSTAPALIPLPEQLPRCDDPRYRDAAKLLGSGDVAGAKTLWLTLPASLDAELLGARIHAAGGDDVMAVRAIEAARAGHATQARVYATAAEIHCAGGRLSSAEDEIREGLAMAGPTPDLTRARGVLALCRKG